MPENKPLNHDSDPLFGDSYWKEKAEWERVRRVKMPSKPTQAEMTEILARGAGCYVRGSYIFDASGNSRPLRTWNPFADPDGLGPIREIEARLSDEQWNQYIHNIFSGIIDELSEGKGARLTGYPGIRHASPAICAEALARTFEPGRF